MLGTEESKRAPPPCSRVPLKMCPTMPSKASTSPPFRRKTQLKLVTPSDGRDELGMGKETFVTRPVQRFHESPETAYMLAGLGAPLKDEQPPSPNAEKQKPKQGN
jgi:hypothetical protein